MKYLFFSALCFILFISCEKENQDVSNCTKKMVSHFKKELRCGEKGANETILYTGKFEGKTVYFTNVMCIYCLMDSPKFGYSCNMDKIEFKVFAEVKEIKQVYNSCTKEYYE